MSNAWPHGRDVVTHISRLRPSYQQSYNYASLFRNVEFEIDKNVQIMLMRIFFDVQGDYRKIGDVILKNLNQNTMEHYGR